MNAAQNILIFGVRIYRWIVSPAKTFVFGPMSECRFTPSCSAYAIEAVRVHGAVGGSWLAAKRICRCHPWGGCGEDAVPPARGRGQSEATGRRFAPTGSSRATASGQFTLPFRAD